MSYNLQANAMPSKLIYIDSRDARDNGRYLATNLQGQSLNSYYQYILQEPIEVPTNQRCLVSLHSATIPYSFYNIREGINDVLQMRVTNITESTLLETGTGEGEVAPLTITAGNYTAYSLADVVLDYVNTTLQDASKTITYTLKMEYNLDTQKYKYTITPTGSAVGDRLQLEFRFLNFELLSPHIEMGFGAINVAVDTGTNGGVRISDNVVDINGSIHGVYIRSSLVSDGTLDSQNGTFSNILSRIPIAVQSGGIIFANPTNQTHKSVVDIRSINSITIRLTDERNRILDLNGLHFQIAISVDFVYAEKPKLVRTGGLADGGAGDSYLVVSDDKGVKEKITQQQAQEIIQQDKRRRGPGRPRRVGRPKGS